MDGVDLSIKLIKENKQTSKRLYEGEVSNGELEWSQFDAIQRRSVCRVCNKKLTVLLCLMAKHALGRAADLICNVSLCW